jgi:hypothetical protein
MKQILVERNRQNTILAWRKSLDRDSSMRVNYDEFLRAVKRLKLDPQEFVPGAMWRAVDRNLSGWVSLREFDQRAFELLGGLRCWSLASFGSAKNMFEAIDSNGGGDVTWKEFSAKLVEFADKFEIGLDSEDVLYMFNGLDLDGQKRLTIDELEFLEKWDLALDLEEEHVFPSFRLWSTGDETKEIVKQALAQDAAKRAVAEQRENEQWKREGMVDWKDKEEEKPDLSANKKGATPGAKFGQGVSFEPEKKEEKKSLLDELENLDETNKPKRKPRKSVFDEADKAKYNPRMSQIEYKPKSFPLEDETMPGRHMRHTLYEIPNAIA